MFNNFNEKLNIPNYYKDSELVDLRITMDDLLNLKDLWKPENYDTLSENDKVDLKSNADFIVYIYADWCGHCASIKSDMMDVVAQLDEGKVFLMHIDEFKLKPNFIYDDANQIKDEYIQYKDADENTVFNLNLSLFTDYINTDAKETFDKDGFGIPYAFNFSANENNDIILMDKESGSGDNGALRIFNSLLQNNLTK